MLEIYEKQNGEYNNKSIKLNDLGMNQSIEFTPKFADTGEGKFGMWYRIKGIYHTENGDFGDVTIWAGQGYYPKFTDNLNTRCTITKVKKDGAKFHTYEVVPSSGGSSSTPLPTIPTNTKFEFHTSDLKDGDGVYTDKQAIEAIKLDGKFDDLQTYIDMWEKYMSNSMRAKLVFEHRKEA